MQEKLLHGLQFLQKLPQHKLSLLTQVILGVYITWLFAQMTWQLFPQPVQNSISQSMPAQANQADKQIDVSKISRLNLFGNYNAAPKPIERLPEPENAPQTKLNLKLTGVVPSSEPARAAAIIEKSGSQDVYGINEKIDGTRAVIKEIFADRVILEQSGRRETLMLEGRDYKAEAAGSSYASSNKSTATKEQVSEQKQVIKEEDRAAIEQLRKDAFSDPGKLIDYIKVNPLRKNGELIGYRLYPGKDAKLFSSVGLKAGDVAIEINGYDLTNLSQALQAMTELKSAQEASLMVDRNGSVTQIFFSLY
ncbi:type II secretion system protein GspC [Catenovulum maritimum]|uniref:Type II secretion system protein GspC N-terminal domain-containing protein n=1 Tax=Catenovulum maritimum TaxID=1513271 RepID=A0A0J8JJP4_9ALTE|nr:type II secretion system protein GspC [Catenovulum maritimum]KMT64666.1 hypothetical protein XM47_13260 [Catenovulum maritimum]